MGRHGADVVRLDASWTLGGDDEDLALDELTYGALRARVLARAATLHVGAGEVVAVARSSPIEQLVDALATWHVGAVVLPVDARNPRAAVDALLARGRPALVLTDDGLQRLEGQRVDERAALLVFTSGSTGAPKGVLLSGAGIAANVDGILEYLPIPAVPDTALVLPLVYCYALVGQALTTLRAGARLHLLNGLNFPARQLEAMAALGRPVGLSSVATSLRLLSRAMEETQAPVKLGYVASAGGRLDAATVALVRRAFGPTRFFNQYGLTEASPRVTFISDESPAFERGSVGRPLRGVEVFVVDSNGQALPAGERGELVVRGPNVMLGYLGEPPLTGSPLRTGDTGFVDANGDVWVEGRNDSVVKVAGERISLNELADELRQVEGVRDVHVIALPDEALGARLVAVVEGAPGVEATLRARGRSLPAYKRPQRLVIRAELPRTANGKLDLAALRALAEQT